MVPYLEQPSIRIGPIEIHAFGVLVTLAVLVGVHVGRRRFAHSGLDARLGEGLAWWAIAGGFLGAHLFSVIFYFPEKVTRNPLVLLKVWEDISSFGSIIGGALGIWLFLRTRASGLDSWHRWAYADVVAFAFPISLAIGRMGCSLAHDHPGTVTSFPLAISLRTEEAQRLITAVYSSAGRLAELRSAGPLTNLGFHDLGWYELVYLALVVVPLFLLLDTRPRPPGFFVAAFIALYMPVRFLLDFLRVGDARYAGLTPGQWVALVALAALPIPLGPMRRNGRAAGPSGGGLKPVRCLLVRQSGLRMSHLSSRANARDLAREWVERGGQDPSVAALPQDDSRLNRSAQSSLTDVALQSNTSDPGEPYDRTPRRPLMRAAVAILLLLLSTASLAAQQQPSARKPGEVVLDSATLKGPNGDSLPFEIGTLYVPEHRANPKSRLIGIGFARFRASAASSAPPIFLLPGGPGFSYLTVLPRIADEIARYLEVSDLIIVDQRGFSPRGEVLRFTARSPTEPADQPTSLSRVTEADKAIARAAVADAAARGIDLAGYTVLECADDVNQLRQALGYQKITLVGTSFGSQWSFAIMRRHPAIVARALLSGVEPLDHGYDSPSGVLAAIQRMAAAAEQDSVIKPYLPPGGLMQAARIVLQRLEREPLRLGNTDSTTGEVATVIGAEDLRRHFPKGPGFAATILSLYYGHATEWALEVAGQRRGGSQQLALVGPLIDGSLGITPKRLKRLRSDTAVAYLGEWNFDSYVASADIWPSPDIGDSIRIPKKTPIPVVFAQGDWDTFTPVENTLEIAPYFPNRRVLIAHNGGHGVLEPIARHHPKVFAELLEYLRTGDMSNIPPEVDLPVPSFPAPSFPPPRPERAAR